MLWTSQFPDSIRIETLQISIQFLHGLDLEFVKYIHLLSLLDSWDLFISLKVQYTAGPEGESTSWAFRGSPIQRPCVRLLKAFLSPHWVLMGFVLIHWWKITFLSVFVINTYWQNVWHVDGQYLIHIFIYLFFLIWFLIVGKVALRQQPAATGAAKRGLSYQQAKGNLQTLIFMHRLAPLLPIHTVPEW